MAKYEETADKKISRKVAREWRKDIIKRERRGLPDPHRESRDQDRGIERFMKAEKKFRGLKEASSPNKYYLGKEYAGGGVASGMRRFNRGGKVK